MKHAQLIKKRNGGYVLLTALTFLGIFTAVSLGLIGSVLGAAQVERTNVDDEQAQTLAQAGIDEAIYQLNQSSSYTGESNTRLGGGTFTVSVSTVNSSTKQITSTGYVPNSTHPVATREVTATASVNSQVVDFHYGVQTGDGGFSLTGGAEVNGSIYADGNISATTGVTITGDAIAADPPATTTDQVNDTPLPITTCTSSDCITFGNAAATQDFAQSFQISSQEGLNNVAFYIKKVGSPSAPTVRIVNDNGGSPGPDQLMSATLGGTVGTTFGWATTTLSSTPILEPGQTYWMIIDNGSNSSSNYYILGANSNGYANGAAQVGSYGGTWTATSPSGLDGYFQLAIGGGTSMIGGNTYSTGVYVGTTTSDYAWAHYIEGATVSGPTYCQVGLDNAAACNTSKGDPSYVSQPVETGDISNWENEAAAGTVVNGSVTVGSTGATLGPEEIEGNLTVGGGGTLTLTGTVWVTGSVTISGGAKVDLASTYGANDGVLLSNGPISLGGGANFSGSGTTGSYLFLVTTSACPAQSGCSGADAVTLTGGAGTVGILAPNGTVSIDGGTSLKEVDAQEIVMDGGASLTYASGLISSDFSDGPGGSWEVESGTYAVVP